MTATQIKGYAAWLRAVDDGPLQVVGTTLLSIAAVNYWFYDRFLLSYVLATQCAGCDASVAADGHLQLVVAVVGGAYLVLLTRIRAPLRRLVWGVGTSLIALIGVCALAVAYGHVVSGTNQRWAAVNVPVQSSVYCGSLLGISTLLLAIREIRGLPRSFGAPVVVGVAAGCLLTYGVSNWSRGAVTSPMAKAALLLAGSVAAATWWKASVLLLLAVGTLSSALSSRSAQAWAARVWLLPIAGAAAVFLTIPHVRDALQPVPLRETVPTELSRVSHCAASRLPESVALPRSGSLAPSIPGQVGYLPDSLQQPVGELQPLLQAAMSRGFSLMVVPATHVEVVSTHTLGALRFEDVCLGGSFRLSSAATARPLSAFKTLGDLIRADASINPTD